MGRESSQIMVIFGALFGALLITLLIYLVIQMVCHKMGLTKSMSRIIAFILCSIICSVRLLSTGDLLALMYVGAALFWFVADTVRKEKES